MMQPEAEDLFDAPLDPVAHPAPPPAQESRSRGECLLASLERIEHALDEVRAAMDTTVREHRHREFSAVRLVGSITQALVVGLLLWALSDWVFEEPPGAVLTKLAFATVLQLAALTAFLLGRETN